MTVVTQLNQLSAQDYPEQKDIFDRLFFTLNPFFQSVTQALQKGLTFADNMLGQEKTLSFVYNGTSTLPLVFPFTFRATPKEFRVCSATENGTPVILLAAWAVSGQTISVSGVAKVSSAGVGALTVGATYIITARISP